MDADWYAVLTGCSDHILLYTLSMYTDFLFGVLYYKKQYNFFPSSADPSESCL